MSLTDSLIGLGSTCVDIARSRLELLSLDLEDAVWRVTLLFCVSVAATLLVVLALVVAAAALIVAWWDSHPVMALAGIASVFAVIAVGALLGLVRWFNRSPFLMRETLSVLQHDETALGARNRAES